jgi:CTP:molybdopterin cytidylyltransferase MocA
MGRHKALLPFGGRSLLARACDLFFDACVGHTVVALRAKVHEELSQEPWWLQARAAGRVSAVLLEPGQPLSASIKALLGASGGTHVILHQVDRPFVTLEHMQRLVSFAACRDQVVLSRHGALLMPPAVVPADLARQFAAEESWNDDRGLASLLQRKGLAWGEVVFDVMDGPHFALDLDTPEDYGDALALCPLGDG